MKQAFLPFFNDRKTRIDTLLFHCSALHTMQMLDILKENQLSCHYIIDTDGSITQVVPEDKRAWHAGLGSWRKIKEDMNSHSIGIELSSLSLGQKPYPKKQIESLIRLSRGIIKRHQIKPQYIIGHSDSAPTRKPDPGKAFPWQYLASQGIGLWYDTADAINAPSNNLRSLLKGIGYNTQTKESFIASQYAFARHFLTELIPTDPDIYHLIENIHPKELDFSSNEKFITTAQAVYMRFNP